MKHCLLCLSLVLAGQSLLAAQVFDEQFDHWPVKTRIGGTLVIANSLDDLTVLTKAIRTPKEDTVVRILLDDRTSDQTTAALETTFDGASVAVTKYSSNSDLSAILQQTVQDCEIFCWHTPATWNQTEVDLALDCGKPLQDYLEDGGKLILMGAVASLAGKLADNTTDLLQPGLNLLPDAILQTDTAIDHDRMLRHLSSNVRTVGVSLAPNTVLVLGGRIARVVGSGSATFTLPAGEFHEVRTQAIKEAGRRDRPTEFLVDWTEWQRDSIDRILPQFPPAIPQPPLVENGTLLIVGGGGMPDGLMDRFVELAGGVEHAKLVYVPCSEELKVPPTQGTVSAWKRMGVRSATFIHTKDRTRANTDEEFLEPLKDATGIWFGGGRQWNLADSYYGTKAHQLMKKVLSKGGVIGGSSAGASIQARYLARATPIENFRIMAPGYERGGLGFISGVAIDQHFSQRGRQKDMTQLVNRYPQMLGIGLDEATAIEVQKSVAKIVGNGRVYFYDRTIELEEDKPDYVSLPDGSVYNLADRKVLVDATESQTDSESQDAKADDK